MCRVCRLNTRSSSSRAFILRLHKPSRISTCRILSDKSVKLWRLFYPTIHLGSGEPIRQASGTLALARIFIHTPFRLGEPSHPTSCSVPGKPIRQAYGTLARIFMEPSHPASRSIPGRPISHASGTLARI